MLEIGCGHGLFLDILESMGWSTYGTEISPKAVEFCQRNHQVFLAHEAKFPNAFFDWITMDNVFEHISEPHELLGQIRSWLKPDGLLTICVPNFGGIDAKFWGPYWYALMPPHHEFHYTDEGLRRVLSACGFDSEIRSQVRFEIRHSASYRGSKKGTLWLQLQKLLHLVTAARIDSTYGYFITALAKRKPEACSESKT